MFFKGSRYADVPTHEATAADGTIVRYKKVRFIPPTRAVRGHTITEGDRLDNIAYRHFRDPERFWRICDANLAMWPADLVASAGETILIPKSEG